MSSSTKANESVEGVLGTFIGFQMDIQYVRTYVIDSLPEIWDKMATDMRTLTQYGDQILL